MVEKNLFPYFPYSQDPEDGIWVLQLSRAKHNIDEAIAYGAAIIAVILSVIYPKRLTIYFSLM